MDEDDGIELAKGIFDTAKDLTGLSPSVGRAMDCIKDKRPQIAMGLGVAAKICTIVRTVSGFFPLAILGVCLAGTTAILDQKTANDSKSKDLQGVNKSKDLQDVNKKLKSMKDAVGAATAGISKLDIKTDKILENTQEILNFLKIDISAKLSNLENKTNEILNFLNTGISSQLTSVENKTNEILNFLKTGISSQPTSIEGKVDEVLEILNTMRSRNGIKKIQTQYRIMVKRPNMKQWAKEFQGQIIAFDENSADFEPENLRELFKFYFNTKCNENYEQMKVLLDLIITTRVLYMQIKINYYQHHDDYNTEDKEIHILEEVENFTSNVLQIQSEIKHVCKYFFVASSLPADSPFFKAVRSDMPGLNERDKNIRLWLIANNHSLAQAIEESSCMLQLLGRTTGPSPQAVINTCYKQFGVILLKSKGSELKAQEFLEFIQEDRESFIADASASFHNLHLDQDTKLFCDKALRVIMELLPNSSFNLILKKMKTMLSESHDLSLWASKFHQGLSDFDDVAGDFQRTDVQMLLQTVYYQKCSSSLDSLNNTHRYLIYARSLYCLIYTTYLANVPRSLQDQIPGFKPVEKAMNELVSTEIAVRTFTDISNSVLSGFYEAALSARPEWNIKLCYAPEFDDIPTTDGNFVKDECWDTLVYGGSYNDKKNNKVYQSEEVPGFVHIYNTDTKKKEIFRYKNNKLQDGSFRAIFSSGDSDYGTRIFDKSSKNGEERVYRLYKFANGDIEYEEQILVVGQDKGWRQLTEYKFNPSNLGWKKVK